MTEETHHDVDAPELPWPVEKGLSLLQEALSQYAASEEEGLPHDTAAARARGSLATAASALYWLEDSDREEDAHLALHELGKKVHDRFPETCTLHWTGTDYEHRCPVRIAHKRLGFSPGLIVKKRICVLCGEDASECEHLPNKRYRVQGGTGPAGLCRVCGREDCAEHRPDELYWTYRIVRLSEFEIDHIAIVAKPRQPDARLLAIPYDTRGLVEALGPEFSAGMTVFCHRCMETCDGFDGFATTSAPGPHGATTRSVLSERKTDH